MILNVHLLFLKPKIKNAFKMYPSLLSLSQSIMPPKPIFKV